MLTRRQVNAGILAGTVLAAVPGIAAAADDKVTTLPPPKTDAPQTLMAALQHRRSTRDFANRPLAPQVLSDLLWAAYGINRPDSGDRTAPCWRHVEVIDLYLAMADGVWFYDPKANTLSRRLADDRRAESGMQEYVGKAPLNIVYVAHGERMGQVSDNERLLWASVDTGFIGQNVYLYCAAQGLATVFRASIEGAEYGHLLGLPAGQFITGAQSVGYPAA